MKREHTAGQSYIKGMDGLRAIGVLLVLISHLWPRPDSMLDFFHFGRAGVILFFVLSGFLVTRSLLDLRDRVGSGGVTKPSAVAVFYGRRVLRIFPLYYLALAYLYWVAQDPHVREHWPWLFFYLSNYSFFFDISFGNADHFWTLAVEEQFYLIIPFIVIFLPPRRSCYWFIVLLVLGLLMKAAFAYSLSVRGGYYIWNYATHPLWGCLEGLCMGGVLAYNPAALSWVGKRLALFVGMLLLVAVSVYFYIFRERINQDVFYSIFAHLCFALCALTVVAYVLQHQGGAWVKILEWKVLRWIGRVSYGVYVIHYIVRPDGVEWVARYKDIFPIVVQPYLLFIGVSLFSLGVASLSFIWIERPLLSLKRFFPSMLGRSSRQAVEGWKRG